MKFLCVVLLVTSLIALATALVQPPTVTPDPICQLDSQCSPHCFCYKKRDLQQRGQCVCTMDLTVLNECYNDRQCIERDSLRDRTNRCSCYKYDSSLATGQCQCVAAVGLLLGK